MFFKKKNKKKTKDNLEIKLKDQSSKLDKVSEDLIAKAIKKMLKEK